jgi:hypothetical protein
MRCKLNPAIRDRMPADVERRTDWTIPEFMREIMAAFPLSSGVRYVWRVPGEALFSSHEDDRTSPTGFAWVEIGVLSVHPSAYVWGTHKG